MSAAMMLGVLLWERSDAEAELPAANRAETDDDAGSDERPALR